MDDTEKQLKFAYYQDQWTHIRHHEQQRSSLTLQLLVISVSLGGAYFAAQHVAPTFAREVQVAAALSILLLSVLGVAVVLRTTSAIKTHVSRARAARESLKFLEEFAQLENAPWPRWYSAAVEELKNRLDRQLVVWLEGRLLPSEIELTAEGQRHVTFPHVPSAGGSDS